MGSPEDWELYDQQQAILAKSYCETAFRDLVECLTCWSIVERGSRRLHLDWHENYAPGRK